MHIAIISWHGHHQNAKLIAKSLETIAAQVSIIYSDEFDVAEYNGTISSHRLPNAGYWSSKYEYAIKHFQSEILFFIHADCFAADWMMVVRTCIEDLACNPEIGVWAPKIVGTPWTVTRAKISRHSNKYLTIVAQTDALVFAVTRPVIDRMRQLYYAKNIFGWGIDWAQISIANSLGLIAVINSSVRISHASGRGYKSTTLKKDMYQFIEQLSPVEYEIFNYLESVTINNKNSLKCRIELLCKKIKFIIISLKDLMQLER